jgi:hypothetical protein
MTPDGKPNDRPLHSGASSLRPSYLHGTPPTSPLIINMSNSLRLTDGPSLLFSDPSLQSVDRAPERPPPSSQTPPEQDVDLRLEVTDQDGNGGRAGAGCTSADTSMVPSFAADHKQEEEKEEVLY